MENEEVAAHQGNGTKRKTLLQLKSLENFYSMEKYPSQRAMEEYAVSLKLTYKQVRGWFAERRRKEKRGKGAFCSSKENVAFIGRVDAPVCSTARGSETIISRKSLLGWMNNYSSLPIKNLLSVVLGPEESCRAPGLQMKKSIGAKNSKRKKHPVIRQDFLTPEYIMKKVFRKDGPPLGVEFDPLPAGAFGNHSGFNSACQEKQQVAKRRKLSNSHILDYHVWDKKSVPKKKHGIGKGLMTVRHVTNLGARNMEGKKSAPVKRYGIGKGLMTVRCSTNLDARNMEGKKSAPVKKYGIGKGLMTVWRATNPDARSIPRSIRFLSGEAADMCFNPVVSVPHQLSLPETRKSQYRRIAAKQRALGKKLPEKRKPGKKQKVVCDKRKSQRMLQKEECTLAMDILGSQAQSDASTTVLMDDEELELRELQAGPNPLTCCAHITTNGRHSCSLCKDLLGRFPPQSVKMKQLFCTRPWNSSSEVVKKLFKVFRFLYTHAVVLEICPFTLDEFAQAFHDKDSLLLGKIHVALLKCLLSDVDRELNGSFVHWSAKDCRYLGFLDFVRQQEFNMKFWNSALNPLTWAEILRLVLIAAGFGSNQNLSRREILSKEENRMAKYGLRYGTLKGELFSILYDQGSNGLKISELAKHLKIVELNLLSTVNELEHMICSTLSSDITLFEKISPSAYRLRVHPQISDGMRNFQSNTEDSGSVDDNSGDSSSDDSDDSEELDSALCDPRIVKYRRHRKQKQSKIEYAVIDESHSGEPWVLGLMEGEYSDLSIEEKLNALVALVDLTGAGFSIRMENPVRAVSENMPAIRHCASGAKLKRSSVSQHILAKSLQGHVGHPHVTKKMHESQELLVVDSSRSGQASKKMTGSHRPNGLKAKDAKAVEDSGFNMHPMKSVCLGSDRRYNSYWLFLGPCDEKDPGHRRVYFESSEDGHWEVIDTEQALCSLLSVLDDRGTRESQLLSSLAKREAFLCQAMARNMAIMNETEKPIRSDQSDMDIVNGDGSSPISDIDNNLTPIEVVNGCMASSGAIVLEHGKNGEEKRQRWDRLQAFDAWIWSSFYSNLNAVKYSKKSYLESLARCESCHDLYWRDEKHCKTCHTTFELDFEMEERYAIHTATCREKEAEDGFPNHKVLPSQLQSLKAAIHAIESAMPEDALLGAWKKSAHKLWVKRLRRTSSLPELLQVLNDFVGAINVEWLCQCSVSLGPNTAHEEVFIFFPTIPQTTSSVALWLVKLDAVIAPHLESLQLEKAPARMPRLRGKRASTRLLPCGD